MTYWYKDPAIRRYILDHYSGTIERGARVFAWVDDGKVVHGNTVAFAIHLGQRFGFQPHRSAPLEIHAVLREYGLRGRSPFTRTERGRHGGHSYAPEPVILPEHDLPVINRGGGGAHRNGHHLSTEGRVVKGRLIQGEDGIWREEVK